MTNISVLLCFIILIAFGFVDCHVANERVGIYELKKGNFSAKFTNLDASLVSLIVPDQNGHLDDVVLGYDSIRDYSMVPCLLVQSLDGLLTESEVLNLL